MDILQHQKGMRRPGIESGIFAVYLIVSPFQKLTANVGLAVVGVTSCGSNLNPNAQGIANVMDNLTRLTVYTPASLQSGYSMPCTCRVHLRCHARVDAEGSYEH